MELDGGQHAERKAADERRTRFLEGLGYRVLRFWDNDVFGNLDDVLEKINQALEDLSLSHFVGEGIREGNSLYDYKRGKRLSHAN